MCWAAKWYGEKQVHYSSTYHHGKIGMLDRAYDLIDEADAVVGYNSKSFDMKHLNREFLLRGYPPPSHYTDIDLLQVVKQRFKFPSNKLQHVASELGIGSKLQHNGFDLWLGCMNGDEKSWETMKRYNIQDVRLTEKVYERLLPWIKAHPHRGLFGGDVDACPRCGHTELITRRYYTTRTGKYRTVQCKGCGGYSKANKVEERVTDTTL